MTAARRPEPPLEVLEAWGQRGVPMDAPEEAERHRGAVVESMARIVREERVRKARRQRWFWAAGAAAAVAAACTIYVVGSAPGASMRAPAAVAAVPAGELQVTSGVVVSLRGGESRNVSAGEEQALSLADALLLGEGASGILALPRGVRVQLSANTQTTLVASGETEQRLRLQRGMVTVSVPKPGGPRTFAISTPDAEVVVHGTQFSTRVEEAKDGSVRTFVKVSHGAVQVTRGEARAMLHAGDAWESPVAAPEPASEAPAAHAAGGERGAAKAVPRTVAERDALAEQNRLFQAALDARAAGDDAAVVRHLDRLLVRFPKTELAREARLTRFRALKRLGRDGEAAREAGRYLLEHPDGPSRGEARDLASH